MIEDPETAILSRLVARRPQDAVLLGQIVDAALLSGQLPIAAHFAERYAALTRGGPWHRFPNHPVAPIERPAAEHYLTTSKIRHDIAQLGHLRGLDLLGAEFDPVIAAYERTLETYKDIGEMERVPLDSVAEELVRTHHGRILHIRPSPRLPGSALSSSWDREAAEQTYLDHPLGILVIDDFLCPEALESLRRFCLESTIWFSHRFAQDRVGTLFRDGFNTPLLLQVAEEIQSAFPRVIGRKHHLDQMWAYRYRHNHRKSVPHADFAAVNVNFWIGPNDANLDPESGGLVIYEMEAPKDWSFEDYNKNGKKIREFITANKPKTIEIPYRENRALIFNSDLFHMTADCRFREGFEAARTNVTMLYGKRNTP